MSRPFWQITGRVTAAVVAVPLVVIAALSLASSEPTSDDEGIWLRDTPTTTSTAAAGPTPEQVIALARSPLGAKVLGLVDTLTERGAPAPTIGQRAVGLEGPIGADVQGITASGTLSPGAQLQKAAAGVHLWPDLDAATRAVMVLCVALIAALVGWQIVGMLAWARARR